MNLLVTGKSLAIIKQARGLHGMITLVVNSIPFSLAIIYNALYMIQLIKKSVNYKFSLVYAASELAAL